MAACPGRGAFGGRSEEAAGVRGGAYAVIANAERCLSGRSAPTNLAEFGHKYSTRALPEPDDGRHDDEAVAVGYGHDLAVPANSHCISEIQVTR